MISLVIPTRNRAHTLRRVAPSYYVQEGVDEIIFVSDAGEDDTPAVISAIANLHPEVSTRLIRNPERLGAAGSRNVGVVEAKNPYVLFCDDDEFLLPGYAAVCLQKLIALNAGAVSGRNVYMQPGETPEDAAARFGQGIRKARPFNYFLMERVNGAFQSGDISVPFTHSIIITRREDILNHPFDDHYANGNGYREESDYQIRLFLRGKPIIVTNDAYCVHLPLGEVTTGGQRTHLFARVRWSIVYTGYFYRKHYREYAKRVGLRAPWQLALAVYAGYALYREILRPRLHALAMHIISQRHVRMKASAPVSKALHRSTSPGG